MQPDKQKTPVKPAFLLFWHALPVIRDVRDTVLVLFVVVPGMIPSHMQHPFVDRYRDTHNSSPRSMVEEDVMNPPTSGTPFTGVNYVHIKSSSLTYHSLGLSAKCAANKIINLLKSMDFCKIDSPARYLLQE